MIYEQVPYSSKKLSRLAGKMKETPFSHDAREKYRPTYLNYKTLLRKEKRAFTQRIKQQLSSDESKAINGAEEEGEHF